MRENIGSTDRTFRIIIGFVLLGMIFFEPVGWWGLIGLVPFLTGIIRYCPLYNLVGLNTVAAVR